MTRRRRRVMLTCARWCARRASAAEDRDRSRRDWSFYPPGAIARAARPCDVPSQAVQQTGEVRQCQPGDGLISVAHPISIMVVNDQPRDLIALEAALGSL